MIEPEDYQLPDKQPVKKPKPKADPATINYLDSLGWRPHGEEW